MLKIKWFQLVNIVAKQQYAHKNTQHSTIKVSWYEINCHIFLWYFFSLSLSLSYSVMGNKPLHFFGVLERFSPLLSVFFQCSTFCVIKENTQFRFNWFVVIACVNHSTKKLWLLIKLQLGLETLDLFCWPNLWVPRLV